MEMVLEALGSEWMYTKWEENSVKDEVEINSAGNIFFGHCGCEAGCKTEVWPRKDIMVLQIELCPLKFMLKF